MQRLTMHTFTATSGWLTNIYRRTGNVDPSTQLSLSVLAFITSCFVSLQVILRLGLFLHPRKSRLFKTLTSIVSSELSFAAVLFSIGSFEDDPLASLISIPLSRNVNTPGFRAAISSGQLPSIVLLIVLAAWIIIDSVFATTSTCRATYTRFTWLTSHLKAYTHRLINRVFPGPPAETLDPVLAARIRDRLLKLVAALKTWQQTAMHMEARAMASEGRQADTERRLKVAELAVAAKERKIEELRLMLVVLKAEDNQTMEDLDAKLQEARSDAQDARTTLEETRAKLRDAELDLEDAQTTLEETRARQASIEEEWYELCSKMMSERDKAQKLVKKKDAALATQRGVVQDLENRWDDLGSTYRAQARLLEETTEQKAELKAALDVALTAELGNTLALQNVKAALDNALDTIRMKDATIKEVNNRIARAVHQVLDLRKFHERIAAEGKQHKSNAQFLASEVERIQRANVELENKISFLNQESAHYRFMAQTLREEVEEYRALFKGQEQERYAREAELYAHAERDGRTHNVQKPVGPAANPPPLSVVDVPVVLITSPSSQWGVRHIVEYDDGPYLRPENMVERLETMEGDDPLPLPSELPEPSETANERLAGRRRTFHKVRIAPTPLAYPYEEESESEFNEDYYTDSLQHPHSWWLYESRIPVLRRRVTPENVNLVKATYPSAIPRAINTHSISFQQSTTQTSHSKRPGSLARTSSR
ncbi:hypothetical protein BD414DRAFT_472389 [Trametes punicea]|nr:hypothetical protein BD414DRAFT_472389 [Trametes punicea]